MSRKFRFHSGAVTRRIDEMQADIFTVWRTLSRYRPTTLAADRTFVIHCAL